MAAVKGCLLVGSVPAPDAETVFKDAFAAMPGRLKRVPDGETGARHYFTFWQMQCFTAYPAMLAEFKDNAMLADKSFPPEQIDEGISVLEKADIQTGYDKAALESYEVFKKLRSEGTIPKGVKFQVCIPTVASVIGPFIQRAFQSRAAPIYEQALGKAMRNVQDAIPHEDLSIQLDLAADTAFWEGVYLEPWFKEDPKTYTVDYVVRMLSWIDQDVEAGIHNCYGDMEHKHWFEPTSLQAVADRGIALLEKSSHKIGYFHCPVPVSASDFLDDYMKPIVPLYEKLKAQGGELYLGVIQYNDLEGTKKRIEVASKYVPEFGVATECGMGRTPKEQVHDLYKLSAEVSEPLA